MSEDLGPRGLDRRMAAALAVVRREGTASVDRSDWDEAARDAYGGEVRAGLLSGYGVPAPARLDRVIAVAAVARLPAARCVEVIAEAFDLHPLPERRY